MSAYDIKRLDASHAAAIVGCFNEIYQRSYANETFNDPSALADALSQGYIRSVGAMRDGIAYAHMAMTLYDSEAIYPELGNTIVHTQARGDGLAWKVGGALTDWCRELGYTGFLHYPTAAHHIMQQQSVKQGFETGLMLSYIPAQTHAGVGTLDHQRGAATIVFEPIAQPQPAISVTLPSRWAGWIQELAAAAGLPRRWQTPDHNLPPQQSVASQQTWQKRSLARLSVTRGGQDLPAYLAALGNSGATTRHLDLQMSDPHIDQHIELAVDHGFVFCGWLPGFAHTDILRLQVIDPVVSNLQPELANPTAQKLLTLCLNEIGAQA